MHRLFPTSSVDDVDILDAFSVTETDHLRAMMVTSVDGAAVADGVTKPLSGATDQALLAALRELCDAVIVGAGTVRAESYRGVKLDDDARRRRVAAGRSSVPPLVIVTRRANFDPTSRVFVETTVAPIIITTTSAAEACRKDLGALADVVGVGDQTVDLPAAIEALRERGLHHLDCEGGPSLLGDLVEAGLVDELCLAISPVVVGSAPIRIIRDVGPFSPPLRLHLSDLFGDTDGFLFGRYSLSDR